MNTATQPTTAKRTTPQPTKKIYISGKITGLHLPQAELKFAQAYDQLLHHGYDPVNPMTLHSSNTALEWEQYIARDIEALLKCQAIYMLPDWKESKGARIEYAVARELGHLVFFENEDCTMLKYFGSGSHVSKDFENKCNSNRKVAVRE